VNSILHTANAKLYWNLRIVIRKLFIFSVGIVLGIASLHLWQNRPEPAPDTSALKNSLQTAAQKEMNSPSLSDANLQLNIKRSQVDQEVNRIKKLATEFGGIAVQGAVGSDSTDVLAQIPPQLVDRFCLSVGSGDHDVTIENGRPATVADPSAGTQFVEVKLNFVR
jgi:hypothetical protein